MHMNSPGIVHFWADQLQRYAKDFVFVPQRDLETNELIFQSVCGAGNFLSIE